MRDILTVIKFTMRDILSRKSFRISTIIVLVVIVLGFNVPNFINSINDGEGFSDKVIITDPDNLYQSELEELINTNANNSQTPYRLEISNASLDDIKTNINNNDATAAIILNKSDNGIKFDCYVKNLATSATGSNQLDIVIQQIETIYTNHQIDALQLNTEQLAQIRPNFTSETFQTEDQEVGGNIFVMMMLSCLLFFAIYFCAYQVSSSITIEKTSKIMETLVTSTSPTSIILGKTIGIGIVGLLQIVLFVVTAIISAYSFLDAEILNSLLDLSTLTPYLAIIMVVYFILGYFTYALLYALTGSTVSKPEDIQSANMPVAIVTMVGFYLAYFTLTDPTGNLNIFAALFPFSSPFCMPLRVMMGVASIWEVLASVIILLITCAIIAHIAIRIYSNAILNYGAKMSLRDIVKTYKEK